MGATWEERIVKSEGKLHFATVRFRVDGSTTSSGTALHIELMEEAAKEEGMTDEEILEHIRNLAQRILAACNHAIIAEDGTDPDRTADEEENEEDLFRY